MASSRRGKRHVVFLGHRGTIREPNTRLAMRLNHGIKGALNDPEQAGSTIKLARDEPRLLNSIQTAERTGRAVGRPSGHSGLCRSALRGRGKV